METIQTQDLSKILKPYSDEWVALSERNNKVVSSGYDLAKVIEKAHKRARRIRL